jgi:flagellar FliJ protein
MKKYAFRLETVRRVRRTQEDIAKANLARANNEVASAIAAVETRIAQYEDKSVQIGSVPVQAFMKHRYFNELAGQSVTAARASLEAARTEADAAKNAWSESAKQVKALDRLDERRREEYAIELSRQIDREVDDVVTGRFGRAV